MKTKYQRACESCDPSRINSMLCHEQGCPDEWRDILRTCFECGFDFNPQERYARVCANCIDQNEGDET